ncbi:GMP synthase (glutamine-hydrolysing) [Georgenia soli]|uniref:GMP synthase (Glutamine-hydrolysing) n=1 Tax=Georgenia soli TaxID=638953 RepID=A0A2A9EM17_9MICO|nr:glutamine amidotransferase [Georgenia soli]PFG39285.1 GMP synthase (glutamine-hydrolysing) [Georgenia soli]
MKPFLLVATRPEDAAADSEYEAFLRYGGLTEDQLVRIRLESTPLPPLDLDDWSGIMLGGSPFTSSIPEEHKSDTQLRVEHELGRLLEVLIPADYPFLGACYGVGTLARHLGATLDGTYSEPISAATIEVTAEGAADPLLEGFPDSFQAFVGHKEAASHLPDGAVLLARGEACPVQMFRVRTNLYGTQFHPELDVHGILERIRIYRDAGYFDPAEQAQVEASVRDVEITVPQRILANFVNRYARD